MNEEYVEVILEGPVELVKGFVIGFLEGRGIPGEAVFEEGRHAGESEGLTQLLRLIGLKEDRVHLIAQAGIHRLLKEALEKREKDIPIRIISARTVTEASFEFRFRAYSQPVGDELKGLFRDLPGNFKLEGYEPREVFHPKADGIEAYAPEHAYEIEAKGTVRGPAKDVIAFYDRLGRYELVELGGIKMGFKDGGS